jgi:hypothetical protein
MIKRNHPLASIRVIGFNSWLLCTVSTFAILCALKASLASDNRPDASTMNTCGYDSECIVVDTGECCKLTAINKKFEKRYYELLWGGKDHVLCDCGMEYPKPVCRKHKCRLHSK